MAQSLAQNAIALLIDLADRGDIDPWDVKVIDVVDRFLQQLRPGQGKATGQGAYEVDLLESGQAFLYASMLVLLKADSLARASENADDAQPASEEVFDEGEDTALPLNLEKKIRRRTVGHPPQNRPVTLPELIQQLEVMSAAIANHRPKRRSPRPKPHTKSKAVKAISELAHQENLAEIAAALEKILTLHWPEMSDGIDWLDFEQLLDFWLTPSVQTKVGAVDLQSGHHHSPQSDRVGVFWGLLFLSAQSKVELEQKTFYHDLKVRSLSHETASELTVQRTDSSFPLID